MIMTVVKLEVCIREAQKQYADGLLNKVDMAVKIKKACVGLIDFEVTKAKSIIASASK